LSLSIGVTPGRSAVLLAGHPAGDAVGVVATDLSLFGVEDIDAVDGDLEFSIAILGNFDVRFAKDDEDVGGVGVLEVACHVEIGVHAGFEDTDAAEFVELCGVGIVGEGGGDDDIEVGVSGLAGGFGKVFAAEGAKLWADDDT